MDNYIAVVFENDEKAFEGLEALRRLGAQGDVTVHGAAVIHRDAYGHVSVATKKDDAGARTALGIAMGALLGALAGPIGAAAGTTIAAGTAAGFGAVAGGLAGVTADEIKSTEHEEAANEASAVMRPGQSAVIAEVSEDSGTPVDMVMTKLGGKVYRRTKDVVRDDAIWGGD